MHPGEFFKIGSKFVRVIFPGTELGVYTRVVPMIQKLANVDQLDVFQLCQIPLFEISFPDKNVVNSSELLFFPMPASEIIIFVN